MILNTHTIEGSTTLSEIQVVYKDIMQFYTEHYCVEVMLTTSTSF